MFCQPGCLNRLRVLLAEQDFEDAQIGTNAAMEAVHAAEDTLAQAKADLHHAQQTEWLRRRDLKAARARSTIR